jgi:hypothetical protein
MDNLSCDGVKYLFFQYKRVRNGHLKKLPYYGKNGSCGTNYTSPRLSSSRLVAHKALSASTFSIIILSIFDVCLRVEYDDVVLHHLTKHSV